MLAIQFKYKKSKRKRMTTTTDAKDRSGLEGTAVKAW